MGLGFDASNRMGSLQAQGEFYPYKIPFALRVDDSASQRMYHTTVAGDGQKITKSFWLKPTYIGGDATGTVMSSWNGVSNFYNTYFSSNRTYNYICDNRSGFVDYNFSLDANASHYYQREFRDLNQWYHFVVSTDTTQAVPADRGKIYINGVDQRATSSPAGGSNDLPLNYTMEVNEAGGQNFLFHNPDSASYYGSFYIAELVYVDGAQLGPEYFGELRNGIWIPKKIDTDAINFGNNGFYLDFADASDLGKDVSGEGHHFTSGTRSAVVENFSAHDQVTDTPTSNFSILNPLKRNTQTQTFAEGNLDFSSTQTSTNPAVTSSLAVDSGKWYWEVYIRADAGSNSIGIAKNPNNLENDSYALYSSADAYQYQTDGNKRNSSTSSAYGDAWTTGDVLGVGLDLDGGNVYFYKNGVIQNSGTAAFTGLSGEFTSYSLVYQSGAQVYNFGQEPTFAGNVTGANGYSLSAGGDFKYQPPAGYKALKVQNLPEPTFTPRNETIENSYFYTTLYEGNGGGQRVGQFLPLNEVKTVSNAIKFDDGDSSYLSWTPTSAGNRKTYTISLWFKRGNVSTAYPTIIGANVSSGRDDAIRFGQSSAGNELYFFYDEAASDLGTSRTFEDKSKWTHLVTAVDTTQATDTDRVKVYIDGERITNFGNAHGPAQDYQGGFMNTKEHNIGRRPQGNYYDGYIGEVVIVDGQALDPTSFGQTDPSTEDWVVKEYTGSLGTNGIKWTGNFLPGQFLDTSDTLTKIGDMTGQGGLAGAFDGNYGTTYSNSAQGTGDSYIGVNFGGTGANCEVITGAAVYTTQYGILGSGGSTINLTLRGSNTSPSTPASDGTQIATTGALADIGTTAGTFRIVAGNNTSKYQYVWISAETDTDDPFFAEVEFFKNGESGVANTWNKVTGVMPGGLEENTLKDTPTKNFMTLGGRKGTVTMSEGNLKASAGADYQAVFGSMPIPDKGKYYYEVYIETPGGGSVQDSQILIQGEDTVVTGTSPYPQGDTPRIGYAGSGSIVGSAGGVAITLQSSLTTHTAGTIFGVAVNMDDKEVSFYRNGSQEGNTHGFETLGQKMFVRYVGATTRGNRYNFGQDSSFAGAIAASANTDSSGGQFKYTPPAGYKALNVDNFPQSSQGIARRKTPVITWIKNRDSTDSHMLFDSLRGPTKVAHPDLYAAETTEVNTLQKFLPGGFQIGDDVQVNTAGESYVAWNWCMHDNVVEEANSAISGSGFTDAKRLVDKRVGISIVTYTASAGTGTIDHGLGQTPDMIIATDRGHGVNWFVWHKDLANAAAGTHILNLDGTTGEFNPGVNHLNDTAPTASAFAFGGYMGAHADTSAGGQTKMLYSFKSVPGFSKFGKWTGNLNTDGPFIHCGFKPAFVLAKNATDVTHWGMWDNQRHKSNVISSALYPSSNDPDQTGTALYIDFLSNGFKMKMAHNSFNGSSDNHIFMAFAELPFKYANAR